jgi:hypothetical protein
MIDFQLLLFAACPLLDAKFYCDAFSILRLVRFSMLNLTSMLFSFAACPLLDAKFYCDAFFFCGLSASRC